MIISYILNIVWIWLSLKLKNKTWLCCFSTRLQTGCHPVMGTNTIICLWTVCPVFSLAFRNTLCPTSVVLVSFYFTWDRQHNTCTLLLTIYLEITGLFGILNLLRMNIRVQGILITSLKKIKAFLKAVNIYWRKTTIPTTNTCPVIKD